VNVVPSVARHTSPPVRPSPGRSTISSTTWAPDARTVERYRPDDSFETLTESLEWRPDRDLPALVIDLPACFDRVHGIA